MAAARAAFLACAAATTGLVEFAGAVVVDFAGVVVGDDGGVAGLKLDDFFDSTSLISSQISESLSIFIDVRFGVAEIAVLKVFDTDGPAELALEVEVDSVAVALGESAHATPQAAKTAAPIPSATAKPPTLPTYSPAPMISAPLDAFTGLEVSHGRV